MGIMSFLTFSFREEITAKVKCMKQNRANVDKAQFFEFTVYKKLTEQ